jgi:hypothetical protein
MRKRNLVVVVLAALVASAGCKKKQEAPPKPADPPATQDAASAEAPADAAEPPKAAIVNTLPADLKWMPFDEKAGEKGGSFAVAYGDPMSGPNGLFIKLPAGNPGMAHTHTGDYHGVSVIGAIAHQQDGKDKAKPLPAGSYWFQPATAPHTSACPGKAECISFIHFNEGKFDFAPAKLDPKGKKNEKHVEKRPADMKIAALMPDTKGGPTIATVWGDNQSGPHGTFWKLPAGFASPGHTHTADYHGVVIKGTVMNDSPDNKAPKEMGPGSYYMQPGGVAHVTACKAGSECLMYSYMVGKFDYMPAGDDAGGEAGSAAGSAGSAAGSAGDAGSAAGSAGSAAPAKK